MRLLDKLKAKKVAVIAAALGLTATMSAGGLITYAQYRTEQKVSEQGLDEVGTFTRITDKSAAVDESSDADTLPAADEDMDWMIRLYKDTVMSEETGRQACEKYGLDYETVTFGEVPREMHNYEFMLYLLLESPDMPLLDTGDIFYGEGILSLEIELGDLNAFTGADKIIKSYCKERGIDPEDSVVSDLTVEQLVEIDELCFMASDHDTGGDLMDE